MAEGDTPYSYDNQGQDVEGYHLNADPFEELSVSRHRIEPQTISKIRSVVLAILATFIVAGLLLAVAVICIPDIQLSPP